MGDRGQMKCNYYGDPWPRKSIRLENGRKRVGQMSNDDFYEYLLEAKPLNSLVNHKASC